MSVLGGQGPVMGNIRARMQNAQGTIKATADNARTYVDDVRERFSLQPGNKEPQGSANKGGVFGTQGSLPESTAMVGIRQSDILAKHTQKFASLNRELFAGTR